MTAIFTLTRSLTARRFKSPDYQSLTMQQSQTLLLCTDGYWQEHLESGTPPHLLRDDASLLTLPTGCGPLDDIDQDTDADNLNDLDTHGHHLLSVCWLLDFFSSWLDAFSTFLKCARIQDRRSLQLSNPHQR
jgi:hypothetical protein